MIIVAAVFLGPIVALATGTLSLTKYLQLTLLPLLLGAACVVWLARLLRHDTPELVRMLPIFGKLYVRHNLRNYFESLALMLEAGLSILDALPKALATLSSASLRRELSSVASRIRSGATFSQSVSKVTQLNKNPVLAYIETGEASGTLPEMLFRYTTGEAVALQHAQQQITDWLPRIIYALVAGWMAYGLLTGPGITPQLPADIS